MIAALLIFIALVPFCNSFGVVRYNKLSSKTSLYDAKYSLMTKQLTDMKRIDINELILELEKTNPTSNPAESSLVNGVWELVVSGLGSLGLVGYQILKSIPGNIVTTNDLQVIISSTQPRAEASTELKIASATLTVKTISNIDILSPTRLRETIQSAKLGELDLKIPESLKLARELIVSYVDEDLLVVRDPLGAPEVLRRKEKMFAPSTAYDVPPADEESGAPGSG